MGVRRAASRLLSKKEEGGSVDLSSGGSNDMNSRVIGCFLK